jgi:FkbM family methyltransferase
MADFPTESDALRRRLFWSLAARFTPWLGVERDGMRLLVSTQDRTLGRRLFVYHRTPERDIERAFATLRAIPGLAERLAGATIVEIGANIGSHTVEMLTRYGAGAVIAIEPHPENCELLRHNVQVNGVADRVAVLALALSDHDGAVALELSRTNSGDHRVRVPGAVSDGPEAQRVTIEVAAARFDTLARDGRIDLATTGLIWMDAQGHEAHILRGAGMLLGSELPIVMEYWPYGLRRAGGLEALHELIVAHYPYVIDLSPPDDLPARVLAADQLPQLAAEYGSSRRRDQSALGTDLLLMPGIRRDWL